MNILLQAAAIFVSILVIDVNSGNSAWKYVLPVITALTSVVTGILGAYKVAEKKKTYRNSAEEIKIKATEYWENVRLVNDEKVIAYLQMVLMNEINSIIKEEKRVISSLEEKEKV